MGSLFTSIGKILNLKFLLIFLSIVFFIDLYFVYILEDSLIDNYKKYIDLKNILSIIIGYLITLNIVIPMFALMLKPFGMIFGFIALEINSDKLNGFLDFLSFDDLEYINEIERKAIKENNLSLMKSYENKIERYNELHSLYLFSFFVWMEFIKLSLLKEDTLSFTLISKVYSILYQNDGDMALLFNFMLIYLPCIILVLFSLRYISSFRNEKIYKWLGKV